MSGSDILCDNHGWPKGYGECPTCRDAGYYEKERKRVAALRADKIRSNVRLGKRYQSASFDAYIPTDDAAAKIKTGCQRYAENFAERLAGCDNLLMLGNPGTGKNMLAACICNWITDDGFIPLHTTAMKIVRKIKDGWNKKEPEQEIIDSFTEPDLLVIDEVGVQFGSRTEELLLTEVINERYEQMRPTIIISNLTFQEIEKYLGPRVIDRFHEGKSAVLQFTWASYRRKGR